MLRDEHRLLRDSLREFSQQRLAPFAAEWDRNATFPKAALAGAGGARHLRHRGARPLRRRRHGLPGARHCPRGGRRRRGATSTIISVNNCPVCSILMGFASEEQKRRYLVPLARGDMLGAFCLTEPHVGSEASGLRTSAVRDGDHWVLNGVKQFITSGRNADIAIVLAVTDKSAGKRGIGAFIVETATPGYVVARIEEKLGVRSQVM